MAGSAKRLGGPGPWSSSALMRTFGPSCFAAVATAASQTG